MFPLARMLSLAAASALVAFTAVSASALAEELPQNLGPVAPHEPILTTVGNKRVLAFFEPGNGYCAIQAVIWNTADVNEDTTSRVRTNLNAGQLLIIDTPDNKTLKLQCGYKAERLAIIESKDFVAAAAGN